MQNTLDAKRYASYFNEQPTTINEQQLYALSILYIRRECSTNQPFYAKQSQFKNCWKILLKGTNI